MKTHERSPEDGGVDIFLWLGTNTPGPHITPQRPRGFIILNNSSIAAAGTVARPATRLPNKQPRRK